MIVLLLSAFGAALIVSALACLVALQLFPWFRSGERKAGDFRPDQSAGGSSSGQQIEVVNGAARRGRARVRSSELPLVGGVAMVIAVVAGSAVAAYLLNFSLFAWELLGVLMAAFVGFALVGFIDDARKVYKGTGISELQKFVGVFLVAGLAAAGLNRLLATPQISARLAYSPYKDLPYLGYVLVHVHYTWLTFFLILTVLVTTTTALAVDFSDGVDGLAGGLLLSASLSYAVILLDEGGSVWWPLAIALLAMAGATLGYLPFNWPSSWRGGPNASGKRRAKLIMGDTGSLALGGLLALVAIVSRFELLLILIGGAFVLEGISALVQGRVLVRIFRKFLFVERFNSPKGFPHTEFPLPFLATPMHHHYELLNWDRRRLVYGAWLLGAGLGVLGIASVMGPFTWERYLARFAGFLLLLLVWQAGPWTRAFFVGLTPVRKDNPTAPRFLALYYGAPFKLFGWPLYARIDVTHATPDAFTTTAERLSLWQLMNVFDARSLLGYYCYQAEQLEDAVRIWNRIPNANMRVRPEISQLFTETRHRLAVNTLGGDAPLSRILNDDAAPLTEVPDAPAPGVAAANGARTTGGPVPVAPNGVVAAQALNGVNGATGGAITGAPIVGARTTMPPLPGARVTPQIRTIGQASQLGRAGQRVTGAPTPPIAPTPVAGADATTGRPTGAPAPAQASGGAAGGAPGATNPPATGADPNASAWRMSKPTTGIHSIPRLQPADEQAIPDTTVTAPAAPVPASQPLVASEPVLWSAVAWAAANPKSVQSEDEPNRQTAPLPVITTPLPAVTDESSAVASSPATSSTLGTLDTPATSATHLAPDALPSAKVTIIAPPEREVVVPSVPRPAATSRPLIVPTLTPSVTPNLNADAAPANKDAEGAVQTIAPEASTSAVSASESSPIPVAAASAPAGPLTTVEATLAVAQDAAEAPTAPRVARITGGQSPASSLSTDAAPAADERVERVEPIAESADDAPAAKPTSSAPADAVALEPVASVAPTVSAEPVGAERLGEVAEPAAPGGASAPEDVGETAPTEMADAVALGEQRLAEPASFTPPTIETISLPIDSAEAGS